MVQFEDLEIWDYIPGYNNYKVSSKGEVWSVKGNQFLKSSPNEKGYHMVNLYKDGKPKTHKIHRLVALTFYFVDDDDDDDKLQVDHIDQDKTNNNLLNLRFCSNSENRRNIGLTKTNTSGYKGVSWNKRYKKWLAQIQINRKKKHLGYFNDKDEAYEAYKTASKQYHGDFGYTP
jgi:hypothetical protein